MNVGSYFWVSDPGHGWLVVPAADVEAVGFCPSVCSYRRGDLAYLEEDCDAGAFLQAAGIAFDEVRGFPERPGNPRTCATHSHLRAEVQAALAGDSNDAEHDALHSVAAALGWDE